MRFLKKDIEVAETSVEEGNHELREAMKGKTLNRDKIVLCQSKITMWLKRKTELKEDLRKLEEKKKRNFVPNRFVFYCLMITVYHYDLVYYVV